MGLEHGTVVVLTLVYSQQDVRLYIRLYTVILSSTYTLSMRQYLLYQKRFSDEELVIISIYQN